MHSKPTAPFLPADLTALINGDERALEHFYAVFQPQIVRIARTQCRRVELPNETAELVQEIWCRFLENDCARLRAYEPDRGPFAPFIRMVAWQQARMILKLWITRRRHVLPTFRGEVPEPPVAAANCATAIERRQLVRCVVREVRCLKDYDHALLRDIAVGPTPAQEIATACGLSVHAINKRRRRLRDKLAAAANSLALLERRQRWAAFAAAV